MKKMSLLLSFCLLAACSNSSSSKKENGGGPTTLPEKIASDASQCPALSGTYRSIKERADQEENVVKISRDANGYLTLAGETGPEGLTTDGQTRTNPKDGSQVVAACQQGKVIVRIVTTNTQSQEKIVIDGLMEKTAAGMKITLTFKEQSTVVNYVQIQ